jgi:carbonic anhydrase
MSGRSPETSESGIDVLLRNNRAHAAVARFGNGCGAPRTGVAVVACMDARIDIYAALGLSPGDAHVIRNAGGVVNDDVIRSLLISRRLLGTQEIMLIHHTDCGMLKLQDDQLRQRLQAETGLELPFALEAFDDLDTNVRRSIARIKSNPYLPHTDEVRGFVYQVETGRLREVV